MSRRIWAGLGVGLWALSQPVFGQAPNPSPAARIKLIQPLQEGSSAVQGRGQAGDGKPSTPMTPMPMGTGPQSLPVPKNLPNPTVTESRNGAATMGAPIPMGAPIILGHGYPVGQPVPGGPVVSAPSVYPGDPILGGMAPAPELEAPLYTGGAVSSGPFGLLSGGPQRLKLDAEFLSWWVRPGSLPPLVTTAPAGSIGALGQPGTQILYGDGLLSSKALLGGRFSGVYWLGATQSWGVDGSIFFLGRNGDETILTAGPGAVLARPFANLNDGGAPFSEIVAAPGLSAGSVSIVNEVTMWGAEANLRRHLWSAPCARLDGFVGFRYMRFTESLAITETFTRTANSNTAIGVPNAIGGSVQDHFRTENNFYAPQIGLTGEVRRGRWFLEGRTSIAMGTVFQTSYQTGVQNIQFDNGAGVYPGGLLVLPGANQGTFGTRRFGVMPEVGLKVGCHLTQNLRVAVGYNFLYLNSVLRPGDQIDSGLDVTKIPNFPLPGNNQPIPGRPRVPLAQNDVYAQGISFSLQWFW